MFVPMIVPPDPAARHAEQAVWFVVRNGEVLVVIDDDRPHAEVPGPPPGEVSHDEPHFLGMLADRPVWAAGVHHEATPVEGHSFERLMSLWGRLPETVYALAGKAVQIVEWDRTHRYCGRCGEPTELATPERARRCPRCGLLSYPRLSPATITLVERGDECLLAWGAQFPGRFFSCLAGFVEPGETLEECVRREVHEEVGIELDEVRYFGSQPWPFPHQLMVGFQATWASGDIEIDPVEIVEAGWYRIDDLPPHPPVGMSIAGSLVEDWKRRQT